MRISTLIRSLLVGLLWNTYFINATNITWVIQPYSTLQSHPGETLRFSFSGSHDVWLLPDRTSYESCDFTDASLIGSASPVSYSISTQALNGTSLFFACSVGVHCSAGDQKIQINIRDEETGSISSPSSVPTISSSGSTAVSASSCDDLGWTNAATRGDELVCGSSTFEGGSCTGLISWDEALTYCETGGARLCTLTELINDETRATGCSGDGSFVWSSTECTGGYSVGYGSSANSGTECSLVSDDDGAATHIGRCCADVFVSGDDGVDDSVIPFPSIAPTTQLVLSPTVHESVTAVPTTLQTSMPTGDVSASSCDDLGWTNAATRGDELVCGSSTFEGGSCTGLISWDEALTYCETGGARLCTLTELINDETRATGCSGDGSFVWSSTECIGGYSVSYGSSANSGTECSLVSDDDGAATHIGRCCADVFNSSAVVGSPTPPPSQVQSTSSPTQMVEITLTPTITIDFTPPSFRPTSAKTTVTSTMAPSARPVVLTAMPSQSPTLTIQPNDSNGSNSKRESQFESFDAFFRHHSQKYGRTAVFIVFFFVTLAILFGCRLFYLYCKYYHFKDSKESALKAESTQRTPSDVSPGAGAAAEDSRNTPGVEIKVSKDGVSRA